MTSLVVDQPKQTVAQFLALWLEQVLAVRNRLRTRRSYQDMVRLHLSPHLGRHLLDKLAANQIQAMLNEYLRPGSVMETRDALRAVVDRIHQIIDRDRLARGLATPPRAD